jgi:hypothetical protein
MSQCPDCRIPFSHEDGHDCAGPRSILVILRRYRPDPTKPPKSGWKPVSALVKKDFIEGQMSPSDYAIARLRAKHPKCEFKFQWYIAD